MRRCNLLLPVVNLACLLANPTVWLISLVPTVLVPCDNVFCMLLLWPACVACFCGLLLWPDHAFAHFALSPFAAVAMLAVSLMLLLGSLLGPLLGLIGHVAVQNADWDANPAEMIIGHTYHNKVRPQASSIPVAHERVDTLLPVRCPRTSGVLRTVESITAGSADECCSCWAKCFAVYSHAAHCTR